MALELFSLVSSTVQVIKIPLDTYNQVLSQAALTVFFH